MKKADALTRLKSLEPRLRRHGIGALYLFGSTARDEAGEGSDLDLLFDVAPGARLSLFDQATLGGELAEDLGAKVDLVARGALHPYLKPRVEAELVRVF